MSESSIPMYAVVDKNKMSLLKVTVSLLKYYTESHSKLPLSISIHIFYKKYRKMLKISLID